MLFGRHFRLQTDHRPLLRIFGSKKGIPVYTASRLQRFALQLQLYDFSIEYIRTDDFGNADVLSRLIREHAKPEPEYVIASNELEEDVSFVVLNSINVFPLNFRDVAKATKSDPVLKQVCGYIKQGWPNNVTYGVDLARFYHRNEALSTVRGCILFGERVVIPSELQQRCLMMKQLHQGHPGIQRMKSMARSYVYWASMDKDIADVVRTCHGCAIALKSPPHEEPVPWPATKKPWECVHVDYAGPIEGEYFLVLVDAHTKWPEVIKARSITAPATIAILRTIFARFGYPQTLVSDNGPQFTSAQFREYCNRSGIQHITIAPFHPQSNGQAERFVDTFKRSTMKIQEGGATREEALEIFLETYRTTPNPVLKNRQTPAEAMLGRRVRTAMELIKPPPTVPGSAVDRSRIFQPGDHVYVKMFARNSWKWVSARIVREIGSVMFEVETENGQVHRRHVNQLRRRDSLDEISVTEPSHLPLDLLVENTTGITPPSMPSPRPVPFVKVRRQQPVRSPRRSSRLRRLPRRLEGYRL